MNPLDPSKVSGDPFIAVNEHTYTNTNGGASSTLKLIITEERIRDHKQTRGGELRFDYPPPVGPPTPVRAETSGTLTAKLNCAD